MVQNPSGVPCHGIDFTDAVDFIAEELDADGLILRIYRENLNAVAPDAELVAFKGEVVPFISDFCQLSQQIVKVPLLSGAQGDDHVGIIDGVAKAVDAADRRHHYHIAALEQAGRGAVPEALNLVIDGGILFDESIRVRDIRFGLIVIVIAHKILHGVFRKELPKLAAELCGKDFIVRQDQGRPVAAGNDVCHGKGLARAGHSQKDLLVDTVFDSGYQGVDGRRLVAHGLKGGMQFERIHTFSL